MDLGLNRRSSFVPVCDLLVGIADLEQRFFGEGLANNLHADGQSLRETGRDGDAGNTGNIDR